ncbi:MAG: transketolase family protein [Microthrixaceae bacterium]
MRDTLIRRVVERMAHDPQIVFLTGDLGFGVLDGLASEFPDRLINAGVSEQNMLGMAAGLALEGFRPFVYSIANFPTIRALEQLRNDICYHRLPVRIVSVGGGLGYGPLGASHHASDDLGALSATPGLALFTPSTASEIHHLTDAACDWPGPVYIRVDRGAPAATHPEVRATIPGKMNTMRSGRDVTVLAYGAIVGEVMLAAEILAADGVDLAVESCVSLRPFDEAKALAAASRGPVVVVEEHGRVGGLATTFAQTCIEAGVAPVGYLALTLGDDFVREVGSTEWLREQKGLDARSIASRIAHLVAGCSLPESQK